MFGISQIRLAIYAVIAVAFLALSAVASHYHSAWVDSQSQIASMQVQLDTALQAAKTCSDATAQMKLLADKTESVVQQAQTQAAAIAKNNQAMATRILNMTPKDADRCVATQILLEDYKAQAPSGK